MPTWIERPSPTGAISGYQVFLPDGFSLSQRWPLLLFLHGKGSEGTDNRKQTEGSFGRTLRQYPDRFPFVVVLPQSPPDRLWINETILDAIDALDSATRDFNGDPTRTTLIGNSMGGFGSFFTAALFPGRFAAITSVAGGIVPDPSYNAFRKFVHPTLLPLLDEPSPHAAFARRIGAVPLRLYHGTNDDIVPCSESEKIAAAFSAQGSPIELTLFENADHYINDRAYSDSSLPQWLLNRAL